MHSRARTSLHVAAALVVALVLTACGSSSSSSGSGGITLKDAWVKSASSGMTAAFVTIVNDGDADVLVSATTKASDMTQLHEMVMKDGAMVMQEKKEGIAVPAKGEVVLEPGGNHIMLMKITGPIKAGDTVAFTLTFKSGKTLEMSAVAKDYDGAKESYQPSASMSSGM